jgi:CHAT domain-containing protein/Tfp pilus assembly protein PilF
MNAKFALLVCLILSWHVSIGVPAPALTEDPHQQAQALLELSDKQNLENHELALQTAQQALALFKAVNDQKGTADTYVALGSYSYALNKMSEAVQYNELALQIWRQQHDVKNEAEALIQLGFIEGRRGEWLNGFSYLTEAQNLLDDENEPGPMARIAAGMGYVFNESGLPEYGLLQYQRAKEYYRQFYLNSPEPPRNYNRQIMLIGYTYFLLENYPAALTNLQQALDHFESSSDPRSPFDIVECREYIGQVHLAKGEYDLALQNLLPIPAFDESKGNQSEAAHVRALIGEVYQRQGNIDLARTNYLSALKTFSEVSPDPVKKAAVDFALGRLELNRGNYDIAESYLKKSIETTEDIRSDLKSRVLAAAFSASVHDRYETYIDCLMRKRKQQPVQGLERLAFEASELARARSLAALLRDTQTKIVTGIDPHLAEQERTLRQAIRAKAEQTITLLSSGYKKEQLDELEISLTRLREQHQQLTRELLRQNPHYDQIKETINYSVQQIQQLIVEDNDTMLLEYFLGKDASYAWAISRGDIKVFELPKADVITEAVRAVYKLLAVEPDNDTDQRLNKAAGELAQMVLTPLANQPAVKRVIVVADGALNYVPFQLLPVAPNNQTPLVEKYEIVNAPSASILVQLRQEKQQRRLSSRILAAFGDPAFPSNYARFKNSASGEVLASAGTSDRASGERSIEVEADSLDPTKVQSLIYSRFELQHLRDIAGPGSFVATGFDASRAALEKTDFSKYAILHFATHGLFDPHSPERSGFILSTVDAAGQPQNGIIKMQDVYNLRVPVDLVVMSACRTGLGKDVRGEGLIGLTRGFMHAGASSVVASLWKVDDEATTELMKYFYTNMLKKGMRPAAALREAQNTLRQVPQWRSPHYWAGFTLQGEFKEPIRLPAATAAPPAVQNAVGGALLATLLAGIGWGFWRRRDRSRYSTSKK